MDKKMETWSRSGTRLEELRGKFEAFKRMPFPDAPCDDALDFAFANLIELDGHVAGLVSTFLITKEVDRNLVYVDEELNHQLEEFIPKSDESTVELASLRIYKKKLDELVLALLKVLSC